MNKVNFRGITFFSNGGSFWVSEYLWAKLKTFHVKETILRRLKGYAVFDYDKIIRVIVATNDVMFNEKN